MLTRLPLLLAVCLMAFGQITVGGKISFGGPMNFGGGGASAGFYTDAITPGSDSNPCTQVSPCATLTHTLTVSGASQVYLKYPDGSYYTAPPITAGLAALYPFMKGSSATTLYDVANGNHGTLNNVAGANCTWYSVGCLWIFTQHPYVSLPDLTASGPATVASFYTPGFDATVNANAYILDSNGGLMSFYPQFGVSNFGMYTNGSTVLAATSNAAQFDVGVYNGASSVLYRNGSSIATGALVNEAIATTVTVGKWQGGAGNYFRGWMSSLLVYSTALTSGNVTSLNTWETNTEQPRTHTSGKWIREGTQVASSPYESEEVSVVDVGGGTPWHMWVTDQTNGVVKHWTSTTPPTSPTWVASCTTTGFAIRSFVIPNPGGGFWGVAPGASGLDWYTSADGCTWTDQGNMILNGAGGTWDVSGISNSSVIVDASTGCKLAYEASANPGIGTATAPYTGASPNPCGTWTKDNTSATPTFANNFQPMLKKSGSTYALWTQLSSNSGFFRYTATTWGAWTQNPIGASASDPAGATFLKGAWDESVGNLGSGGADYIADPYIWDDAAFGGGVYLFYTAVRGSGTSQTKGAFCNCTLAQLVASTEQMTGTNP